MLDEAIGRAVMASVGNELWGVTAKFADPVQEAGAARRRVARGRTRGQAGRAGVEGSGEILLAGWGSRGLGCRPLRDAPAQSDRGIRGRGDQEWGVVPLATDPVEFPLP